MATFNLFDDSTWLEVDNKVKNKVIGTIGQKIGKVKEFIEKYEEVASANSSRKDDVEYDYYMHLLNYGKHDIIKQTEAELCTETKTEIDNAYLKAIELVSLWKNRNENSFTMIKEFISTLESIEKFTEKDFLDKNYKVFVKGNATWDELIKYKLAYQECLDKEKEYEYDEFDDEDNGDEDDCPSSRR